MLNLWPFMQGKETKESTELASSSAHQEDISQITVLAAVSIVQPEIVLQNSTQEIASVDLQPETAERQLGNNNLQEKALPGHQKSASKVQQLRLKLTAYRSEKPLPNVSHDCTNSLEICGGTCTGPVIVIWGPPCQSIYFGWSVITKKCGHLHSYFLLFFYKYMSSMHSILRVKG